MLKLWEAWPIAGPWHLSPLSGGTNNSILRADTAEGKSFVLRLIADSSHIPHILYEATLLEALSAQHPPFLLPVPLKTHYGDVFVSFQQDSETTAFAILSHLLPGTLPDRNNITIATHAGSTLARFDHALATLPTPHIPKGDQSLPTFGKLSQLHPLVSEPLLAVKQLPIETEHAKQISYLLASVMGNVDDLYNKLPQQLLHRDYDPSNILVQENQITAILDFEFAGVDLRVLEICVALSWWPVNVLGTGKEWDIIDAFGNAYIEHFPLDEEELLAFPAIWRLRDAASFVHRVGRYIVGLGTDAGIRNRVRHSLWREAWLSANQETLVQHALAWGRNANR